jgi:hypothetical protein
MILAGLTLFSVGAILPVVAAEDLVANPEKIFKKGMKVTMGNDHGLIELKSNGGAIMKLNGTIYRGKWEKVDEYHVKTTWRSGGPQGGIWSLRKTGNSANPYVAIRNNL